MVYTLRSLLTPNAAKIGSRLERFGSENDGGYLLFDTIAPNTSLLSFGIGDNLDFESDLAPKVNKVLAFDGSITKLPKKVQGLDFVNKYVGVQTSTDTASINEIIAGVDSLRIILKIDIEGAEWRVLAQLSDFELERFDQIVGEFHGLSSFKNNQELFEKNTILERLSSKFTLVNCHPNNWSKYRIVRGVPIPDAVELTFLKSELYSNLDSNDLEVEVRELNAPCNPAKPEFIF
jgi:hypothetical protein